MDMKLHLWCWYKHLEGYVNLDRVWAPGVDVVHDLEIAPYPFKDDTFEEIYTSMVLEHIKNLSEAMDELYRISKDWCLIKIVVPYFSSPNLWGDMTHVRWFNTNTFSQFHCNSLKSRYWFAQEECRIHFLSNSGNFMKSDPINVIPDFFINLLPKWYERFFAYLFPSSEIHYTLRVVKAEK